MPRLLTSAQISHIKANHPHSFWGIVRHFAPSIREYDLRDTLVDETDTIEQELYGNFVPTITVDTNERMQLWFNALCHSPLFLRHASNLPAPKLQTTRRHYAS